MALPTQFAQLNQRLIKSTKFSPAPLLTGSLDVSFVVDLPCVALWGGLDLPAVAFASFAAVSGFFCSPLTQLVDFVDLSL